MTLWALLFTLKKKKKTPAKMMKGRKGEFLSSFVGYILYPAFLILFHCGMRIFGGMGRIFFRFASPASHGVSAESQIATRDSHCRKLWLSTHLSSVHCLFLRGSLGPSRHVGLFPCPYNTACVVSLTSSSLCLEKCSSLFALQTPLCPPLAVP